MMNPPPTRYRVIERGRRLITIDTATGEEINHGSKRPEQTSPGGSLTAVPVVHAPMRAEQPAKSALSDIMAARGERPASLLPPTPKSPGANQGKLIGLIVGAIALFIFLAFTGLWMFVVVAMLIPPVRALAWTKGKEVLRRYFDQAATG